MNNKLIALALTASMLLPLGASASGNQSSHYSPMQIDSKNQKLPKIVSTISGDDIGPADIGINERTNRIYAANIFKNTVSVMDGRNDTVISTIPVLVGPASVAVDESSNKIYVGGAYGGGISILDGKTSTISDTIPQSETGLVNDMVLNHKTNRLYVANYKSDVLVIDQKTKQLLATIPDDDTNFLAVNEKSNTIYITNYFNATVSVVDGNTNQIVQTIPVGTPYSPDDCYLTNNCVVIGSGPDKVAVNEKTNRIYVDNVNDGTFVVIDGKTNTVIKTLQGKHGAFWSAVDEDTNTIYSTNFAEATLSIVDGKTNKLLDTVAVGSGFTPSGCYDNQSTCTSFGSATGGVSVNEKTGKIYVGNIGDFVFNTIPGSIVVLDAKTHHKISEVHGGHGNH